MNSEITKHRDAKPVRGWIFYDASCGACVRGRGRTGRLFASRGFEWLPLQTAGTAARLGVPESALQIRMHVLSAEGRVFYNADALGVLCRSVWWLSPIGVLLRVPGIREFARLSYDWLARHRYRVGGVCGIEPESRGAITFADLAFAALILLTAGVLFRHGSPWLFMWALAFGCGFGLKWLTWRDALIHGACPSPSRAFAWFLLWPGMDGRAFLSGHDRVERPSPREWFHALATLGIGMTLIVLAARLLLPQHAVASGWVVMVGVVLCVHFGVIRLLSVFWRHRGVQTEPIMRAPFRAASLAEFWGTRWNTAFNIPARRLMLRPLARQIGLAPAAALVFLISGLLHELVISIPARGGFGGPTFYFALQAAGVALERSRAGRRWGLGEGITGRVFVLLLTIGPLQWLFHRAFVDRVVIPFLSAIHS